MPTPASQTARRIVRPVLALAVLALVIIGACHPGNRLAKANVDQVQEGMAKKQVESILGAPASITSEEVATIKKTTYVYNQAADTVTIVFKEDKVESKETTLTN